jgi:hypothetical protein
VVLTLAKKLICLKTSATDGFPFNLICKGKKRAMLVVCLILLALSLLPSDLMNERLGELIQFYYEREIYVVSISIVRGFKNRKEE